jgi:hypothetical protein
VKVPGELKLNTITDPYTGSVEALGRVSSDLRLLGLKLVDRFPSAIVKREVGLSLIEKSSSSSVSS